MSKLISRIRDLILLGLLLFLFKVAMDRKETKQQQTGQVLSSSTEQLETVEPEAPINQQDEQPEQIQQTEPEAEPIQFSMDDPQEAEPEPAQKIPTDEPKKDMLSNLDATGQQINTLFSLTPAISNESTQLHSMRQRLGQLKKSYQRIMAIDSKDSGAIIELGMKKEQIEANLLRIVQLIGRIIRLHAGLAEQATIYDSIDQGIRENEKLLNELDSRSSRVITK